MKKTIIATLFASIFTVSFAEETLSSLLGDAKNVIVNTTEKVVEVTKDGANAVVDGVKAEAEVVKDKAKDGAEMIMEGVKKGSEAVSETASDMKKGATEMLDELKDQKYNDLKSTLEKLGLKPAEYIIQKTPIKGIVEVIVMKNGVVSSTYTTEDGEYVFDNAVLKKRSDDGKTYIDIKKEKVLKDLRLEEDKTAIIYKAPEEKYSITAFVDYTCHYCQKLFANLAKYNEKGITVKLLAYPRAGLESDVAKRMETIFKDQSKELYEKAEKGGDVPLADNVTIVTKHYNLGDELGLEGTPTIVLPDNEILGGYLSPNDLVDYLEEKAKAKEVQTDMKAETK